MLPKELIIGVEKLLEAGASRERVRSLLSDRGWAEKDIQGVFKTIDSKDLLSSSAPVVQKIDKSVSSTPQEASVPKVASKFDDNSKPAKTVRSSAKNSQPTIKTEPTAKAQKTQSLSMRTPPSREGVIKPVVNPAVRISPPAVEEKTEGEKESKTEKDSGIPSVATTSDALPSPFALSYMAISLFKSRFVSLLILSTALSFIYVAIYGVVNFLVSSGTIENALSTTSSESLLLTSFFVLALLILLFIAGGVFMILPAAVVVNLDPERLSLGTVFKRGLSRAFSLFWVFVIASLFVAGGSLFLFVPGLLFLVWFSQAPMHIIYQKVAPFRALLASQALVRDNFWAVVGRLAFLIIPFSFALLAFLIILSPISTLDVSDTSTGFITLLIVIFALVLLIFSFSMFFFAYIVSLYRELIARVSVIKSSRKLSKFLVGFISFCLLIAIAATFIIAARP